MYNYTTKDVMDKHQFTSDFVNKCLKRLSIIFKGHLTRGDYNARLFDGEAMRIFDIIAQKKKTGHSISEIENALLQGLQPILSDNNGSDELITTPIKTPITDTSGQTEIIRLMDKHQRELKEEYEKRFSLQTEKDEAIRQTEALSGAIKLITDGKDPNQFRKEREAEREERARLQAEKDEAIKALEREREALKNILREKEALIGDVKFLANGKDIDQVKKEREEKQRLQGRIEEKQKQIDALDFPQWLQKRKLKKELDELKSLYLAL